MWFKSRFGRVTIGAKAGELTTIAARAELKAATQANAWRSAGEEKSKGRWTWKYAYTQYMNTY